MANFTYRYCEYIPNLYNPAERHVFAVAVASENEIALVGIDLSSYRLNASNEFDSLIIGDSFNTIWKRILDVLKSLRPTSGHKALEMLENRSATNIYLSPLGTRDSDQSTRDFAFTLFAPISEVLSEHRAQLNSDSEWFQGPRMNEQLLAEPCGTH